MRKVTICFVAMLVFHVGGAWCDEVLIKPDISIEGRNLLVKNPKGVEQIISLDHNISLSDVTLESLTFNKFADIKVLDTEGASQKLYKVYLYRPTDGMYVYSKELSDVPCLQVDGKRKELVGACFHESACENWVERYKVTNLGKLSLVEQSGTYCDPTGQTYSYTDKFRNGKKISSTVKPSQ
ncbi:XAC2610-related protein [Paraburkholderia domus]|uniref:XAC2610-related protein n=1 Tax=Paraburkholderia domus TaxID=2793075 RepID=UPI0019112873|nr:hypothetical protein [Paraburkholderia domus]MBK5164813.1 hypothetical protein [Burkholderia sp. R-70211]